MYQLEKHNQNREPWTKGELMGQTAAAAAGDLVNRYVLAMRKAPSRHGVVQSGDR